MPLILHTTMNLTNQITAALKQTSELEEQFQDCPFDVERIEALGAITASETLLQELEAEPDSMSPGEIIAARQQASNALEAAKIEHRRAEVKCSQFRALLFDKLNELKNDALPIIQATRQQFEERIKAAMIELAGGYFSDQAVGYTVPTAIAQHRSRALKCHERTVDGRGYASVSASEKLRQIRSALEACKQYLA